MGVKFTEIVIREESDSKYSDKKENKEKIEEIGHFLKKAES